jgi:hypothetical protein
VQASQHAVAAAQCEELPAGDIDGEIVAGLSQSGERSKHLPLAPEDLLPLLLVDRRIHVVSRLEIFELGLRDIRHES